MFQRRTRENLLDKTCPNTIKLERDKVVALPFIPLPLGVATLSNVDLDYLSHVGNLFEKTGRCWDLHIKDDFLTSVGTELCGWKSKMCRVFCVVWGYLWACMCERMKEWEREWERMKERENEREMKENERKWSRERMRQREWEKENKRENETERTRERITERMREDKRKRFIFECSPSMPLSARKTQQFTCFTLTNW